MPHAPFLFPEVIGKAATIINVFRENVKVFPEDLEVIGEDIVVIAEDVQVIPEDVVNGSSVPDVFPQELDVFREDLVNAKSHPKVLREDVYIFTEDLGNTRRITRNTSCNATRSPPVGPKLSTLVSVVVSLRSTEAWQTTKSWANADHNARDRAFIPSSQS